MDSSAMTTRPPMLEKLTDEELDFIETFYNPIAMAQIMFSNYDNLSQMQDDKLAHLRMGQIPLLSHEYLLDFDPSLGKNYSECVKANFQLRKGAGDVYALGGRLFGKTLFVEKIDFMISVPMLGAEKVGFSSLDALHIKGVLEEVAYAIEHHPFLKLFEPQTYKSPNYRFSFKNGYVLESVNMNLYGKNPGSSFFQKHFTRLYIEEASFESEQVYRQRRDSVSEIGCIFRCAGMTNFTKSSVCGNIFYAPENKQHIVNLPQYVNPNWNATEKKKAIKDFSGEQSINFRMFIKGEVVEDGITVFDMERVRACYNEDKKLQTFEITKKNFDDFQYLLLLERPKQADQAIIFADIGETAPTEIGIVFRINEKYRYCYNITLYNLTDKQQFQIFRFLALRINANFIGIDCTDGTGRAIYRSLEEVFSKDNLIWVAFNEKLPVDFERDPTSNQVLFKDGKPLYKEEYVRDWSIHNLKSLLYSGKMELPLDHKFDKQFDSVKSMQSGQRLIYYCSVEEDHLFQAFQVFSIVAWNSEFILNKPVLTKKFHKTGV